jgi:hypothetical protein
MCISKNQFTIVVNLHHDFAASAHNDFFQGMPDNDLIYQLNHFGETLLSNQEGELTKVSAIDI